MFWFFCAIGSFVGCISSGWVQFGLSDHSGTVICALLQQSRVATLQSNWVTFFSRTKTYEASVFDVTLNLLLSFDQLFEVCARSTLVVSSFLYATLNLTIYSCFLTHKIHAKNSNLPLSTSFSQPCSRSLSSQFLSGKERAWERGCHLYKFQTNVDCRSYNTRQK